MIQPLLPPGWPRPSGYANGIAARGRLVFVAGQIGWTPQGVFESDDFVTQTRQALCNTRAVLEAGGAEVGHIVRMTWYVTDKRVYLAQLAAVGAVYKEVIGAVYPAMAMVQVVALMEDRALVEIETTAVVPEA